MVTNNFYINQEKLSRNKILDNKSKSSNNYVMWNETDLWYLQIKQSIHNGLNVCRGIILLDTLMNSKIGYLFH